MFFILGVIWAQLADTFWWEISVEWALLHGEDRAAFESKIAFARELVAGDQQIRTHADRPDSFHEYMFVAQLRKDSGYRGRPDGQHPMRLNFDALQERYTDEVDTRVAADLASGLGKPTKEEHLVARLSLLPERSEDEASIAAALNEALRWGRPIRSAQSCSANGSQYYRASGLLAI